MLVFYYSFALGGFMVKLAHTNWSFSAVIKEFFMGIAFQIVSVILIIGAVLLFWKRTSSNTIITKGQKALSVFQIVLCGGFFALCLSDVLDISANFSAVRFFLNIFYALTFLSLTAFALSDLQQKKQKHIQMIVSFCAALIAVQCFVFPYDAACLLFW